MFISSPVDARTNIEVNIFREGAAYTPSTLTSYESQLGMKFNSVMWYQDFDTAFEKTAANNIHNSGHYPILTWQPMINGSGVSYDAVAGGSMDAYLATFAKSVASLGYPMRISLAPEMNLPEIPWAMGANGNNGTNFVAFWRHVVDVFRSNGASNVSWVWSPNIRSYGDAGAYSGFYPGDSYVTYLGLDGYNWGTSQSWSTWQTFDQVFKSSYNEIVGVSSKSILINEMACSETGGNKAAWITNMFSVLQNGYPKIMGFTWFDIKKETDWRINSSAGAQTAFVNGVNGIGGGATTNSSGSSSGSSSSTKSKSSTNKKATTSTPTPTVTPTPTLDAAVNNTTMIGKDFGGHFKFRELYADTSMDNTGNTPRKSLGDYLNSKYGQFALSMSFFSGASILWLKRRTPQKKVVENTDKYYRHFDGLMRRS
ncbi:MAG: glycosyl hydrolase [Actinomycetota bacterium]